MTVPFFQESAPVLINRQLARDTYLIRLETPAVASAIRPGQFVMLRLPGTRDPLLGRPFALYDTVLDESGEPTGIDVVYLVVGKMTGRMKELPAGDRLEVWGPLGNGFPDVGQAFQPDTNGEARQADSRQAGKPDLRLPHVGLVAGGIGQTPFLAHIRELLGTRGYGGQPPRRSARSVSIFCGVRSADLAAGIDDFRAAGAAVHLASNDGTLGHHGFVTDLVAKAEGLDHLIGCGPEPMLHALAKLAEQRGLPCHLSLETPMACGVGICFSCVTKVKTGAEWDYKRVCVDGPVFDARNLRLD